MMIEVDYRDLLKDLPGLRSDYPYERINSLAYRYILNQIPKDSVITRVETSESLLRMRVYYDRKSTND